jgi:hypothetical protein
MNKKLNLKKWGYLILLFSVLGQAQITKGNWMVGGSGSFTTTKSYFENNNVETTQTVTGLNIDPNIGYFVFDKFAIGTAATFNFTNPKGRDNSTYGYGLRPFIRYYFLKPEKIINVFSQASYGFYEGRSQNGDFSSRSDQYEFKAGPAIFFNSSVALELTLNYYAAKNSENDKYNYFSLGIGFQIHLEK